MNARPHVGADWFYQLVDDVEADGLSGVRRTATHVGRTSSHSTSFWVGCDGPPPTTTFRLNGFYDRLSPILALDRQTPKNLRVLVCSAGTQGCPCPASLTRGRTSLIDVSIQGARTLTLAAKSSQRPMRQSVLGYGVAFEAKLRNAR
jgi:hypothetical protein